MLTALAVGAGRSLRAEWLGSPPHRLLLAKPRPDGFAAEAHAFRPTDAEAGRRILKGDFRLAGASLAVGPRGDPWDRPSPSRAFADALHRFDWLPDLMAAGPEGPAEALRLTLEWRRVFGAWNAYSWSPAIVERRLVHLASAAKTICARASEAEVAAISLDLARQARHLLAAGDGPARAAEQGCAAALAGAAMSGTAGQALLDKGLAKLVAALPRTVAPDGGHASRSPQAALELLFDLLALDDALAQRGLAPPDEMMRAIDRLRGAVRFFTLADGALADFQGGAATSKAYVAAAKASEGAPNSPPASRNGYQRLEGKTLQVVADAAAPAQGPWSLAACAQPLAFEVLAAGRRLIVGAGWTPGVMGPPSLRTAEAASTAALADAPCGAPAYGFVAAALGPRLVDAYAHVEARRHEEANAVLLEMAHDGWVRDFGLRHERALYLDRVADELRGEDGFSPVAPPPKGGDETRRLIPFVLRFHLHPEVRAQVALDRKSVLLRRGDEAGWWLRSDANEVSIETSVHYLGGQPRRTEQVVLRGHARPQSGARLRWKLVKAEAWPPPH